MILYHGSNVEIRHIDLNKSARGKDFGKGFYLSEDEKQAEEMAVFKSLQTNSTPIVNSFEFDERAMSDHSLRVKIFKEYSLEWAEFVFKNRSNRSDNPIHEYDIVYGPIADDKVGVQIRNFMEGNISIDVFLERLKFIKGITFQYFFGTEVAIKLLKKTKNSIQVISFDLNFATPSHFSKFFKDKTGQTPKEFRKMSESAYE